MICLNKLKGARDPRNTDLTNECMQLSRLRRDKYQSLITRNPLIGVTRLEKFQFHQTLNTFTSTCFSCVRYAYKEKQISNEVNFVRLSRLLNWNA